MLSSSAKHPFFSPSYCRSVHLSHAAKMACFSCLILISLMISCRSYPATWSKILPLQSIVSRTDWGGRDPTLPPTNLGLPVSLVVVHHTYIPGICLTKELCKSAMRGMQNFHQHTNGWSDIGYNFAVGGEGRVYEGRGWGAVGAHAYGVNSRSIGIALIGDFVSTEPATIQTRALQGLIEKGVQLGYISPDYRLIGHHQVSATECPGGALFQEISTWDHFDPHFVV